MKRLTVILVSVLMLMVIGCQSGDAGNAADPGDQKINLDTEKAKVSYSIGFNMGQNLGGIKDEIDLAILFQAIRDGLGGEGKAQISQKDRMEIMKTFQGKIRDIMEKKREEQGRKLKKNKEEGEAFLKENGSKEGVITTASGLQYQVIQEGNGPTPKATDTVEVHYRGTLIDGTEFDSSYSKGQPAKFALNRVIPAWTEGVQLMKVGSKYKFFAPSNLAYGPRGSRAIGPNAVLIFEIELLSIVPPQETPKPVQPKQEPAKK